MSRADLVGYAAAAIMLAGVLVAILLLGGRGGRRRTGAPRADGRGRDDAQAVHGRLARLERAVALDDRDGDGDGRGGSRAAGHGEPREALQELAERVAALEAQAGTGPDGSPPGALPSAQNPGMSRHETALLAAVNRAWEQAPEDRAGYGRLCRGVGLPGRFFALRNIDRSLQTLWDDTFTFVPSDDEGGWLLCEDEGPAGSRTDTVLALPADPAFFRFAGVMTLVRRMFDGVPAPSASPDPRFVRAYRACRLRAVEPDRYKLIDRGQLLLGGEEDRGWPRPLPYEALRPRSIDGGGAGGALSAALADAIGRLDALEERLESLQREVAALPTHDRPGRGGPLSEADLARLALELARLAARR